MNIPLLLLSYDSFRTVLGLKWTNLISHRVNKTKNEKHLSNSNQNWIPFFDSTIDIIYGGQLEWDLLVHSTHMCVLYVWCFIFFLFFYIFQSLTNDVLQILEYYTTVKMVLDMKTKFNMLLHFFFILRFSLPDVHIRCNVTITLNIDIYINRYACKMLSKNWWRNFNKLFVVFFTLRFSCFT